MTYKRPTSPGPRVKPRQGSRPGPRPTGPSRAPRSGGPTQHAPRGPTRVSQRPTGIGGQRPTGIKQKGPNNTVRAIGKKRPTLTKEEAAFAESDPTLSDDWLDEFMP